MKYRPYSDDLRKAREKAIARRGRTGDGSCSRNPGQGTNDDASCFTIGVHRSRNRLASAGSNVRSHPSIAATLSDVSAQRRASAMVLSSSGPCSSTSSGWCSLIQEWVASKTNACCRQASPKRIARSTASYRPESRISVRRAISMDALIMRFEQLGAFVVSHPLCIRGANLNGSGTKTDGGRNRLDGDDGVLNVRSPRRCACPPGDPQCCIWIVAKPSCPGSNLHEHATAHTSGRCWQTQKIFTGLTTAV
jgi:hypothetical protein